MIWLLKDNTAYTQQDIQVYSSEDHFSSTSIINHKGEKVGGELGTFRCVCVCACFGRELKFWKSLA